MLNWITAITVALMAALFLFGLSCNGKGPSAGFAAMAAMALEFPLIVLLAVLIALRF